MADEGEYFELLSGVLRRHGFSWVIAQAQIEIREGRAVTKEVRAPDIVARIDDDGLVRRTPQRRRAALVATEPYTATERLEILMHGIKAAIIDRVNLEEAVLEALDDVPRIEFIPDDLVEGVAFAESESGPHKIERGGSERGLAVRRDLAWALQQVREVTDVRAQ